MVGRELFERVVSHAMAAAEGAERPVNTAHLKANKSRPLRRCVPTESGHMPALFGAQCSVAEGLPQRARRRERRGRGLGRGR